MIIARSILLGDASGVPFVPSSVGAAGFDVLLDDGRLLRVPPGRLRLQGKLERVDVDRPRIERLVSGLDPHPRGEARDLFPFDHARALTIGPGDRVEILGEVEAPSDERTSGYRSPASVLEPVGVPVLRVRKGSDPPTAIRVADAPPEPQVGEAEELDEAASDDAADRNTAR